MTKFRWIFVAFALLALVLALTLSRRPPPVRAFPSSPLPVQKGKVQPQLEVTHGIALMLAPDGTLWHWGSRDHSSLVPNDTGVPQQIGTDSDWVQIACGFTTFALALKADGSMWGWGATGSGPLGSNYNSKVPLPQRIDDARDWAVVRGGASHALGLKRDGSLWAWGQNDKGQVGDNSTSNKSAPTLISEDRDWKQVDAGHFNSFAIRSNGTLWIWGFSVPSNAGNDLLVPTQIDSDTNWAAVSAGDYHAVALKSDGTLWLRGQNAQVTARRFVTNVGPAFVQVGSDSDWSEVFSGANNFYARKKDGSWWVCGSNNSGQLAVGHRQDVPAPVLLPRKFESWAFDAGGNSAAILLGDGSLWTAGERMGTPKRTIPFKPVRDAVNRVTRAIGLGAVFDTWQRSICDEVPTNIWSFPPGKENPGAKR